MPAHRDTSSASNRLLRISAFAFVSLFCAAIPLHAQQAQIGALAGEAAQVLKKSHAKRVVVLDFSGPGLEVTQLGRDLADQFSEALSKSGGKFVVADRTQLLQALSTAEPPMTTSSDLNSGPVAKLTHADLEVLGHLETNGDHVSLALEIRKIKNGKTVGRFSEQLFESEGMAGLLGKTLSVVDYPDAGAIGYTVPTCRRCPAPSYTDSAFNARIEGLVILSVVIEPDGRAHDIIVTKKLGLGLDESAVKAVQNWEFRPCIGPNGMPVAVHMLIGVNFRLYARP